MAISTKISQQFQDFKLKETYEIDKYDISEFNNLYNELNNINDRLENSIKKYITEEEISINRFFVDDEYSSTETIIESNKELLFKTSKPLFMNTDSPDDNSRKPSNNIQADLVKIHKIDNLQTISINKNKKILNRYQIYLERIKKLDAKRLESEFQAKQEKKQALIRNIQFLKITATTILCVINFVVMANITNPQIWMNMGLYIYNNKFLFKIFSDIMVSLNLFNITDSLTLKTLFDNMILDIATSKDLKNLSPEDMKSYVELIIKKVFNSDDKTISENIKSELLTKFRFYEEKSSIENFFTFIYSATNKTNIFKANSVKFDESWISVASELINNPITLYGMSQLGLVFNTFAYFERATKIFNEYSEINPMIIFKEITNTTLTSISFNEYNRLFTQNMLSYVIGEKTTKLICEIPYIVDIFGTEFNIEGKIIKKLSEEDIRGFFVITTESLTSILINNYVSGYFTKIEEEAKNSKIDKSILKTEKEKIMEIEKNLRTRGKYVLQGYSSEKITKLLQPPKKNDYQFIAFRCIKDFYNVFDEFVDDPILYMYTLTTSISLSKIIESFMAPIFLSTSIYSIQKLILTGMYDTFLFNIPYTEIGVKTRSLVWVILSFLYGSDAKINLEINKIRSKIINQITNDVQLLISELQQIFFDTRVGINIQSYIDKISETIIGNIFKMSCKIIYYIVVIPQFQKKLSNMIPPSNIKPMEILKDRNKCIRYFSVIRNKISNIFTIFSSSQRSVRDLIKELKSFFDIDKIIFFNIIPFVANDGYYKYDTSKLFEFKGTIIKYLNNEFEKRFEKEEKKSESSKTNLLDFEPKQTEIEKELLVLDSDTESRKIKTINFNNYLLKLFKNIPSKYETIYKNKNDILTAYYYTLFVNSKKKINPNYQPILKDFDKFLSDIANEKRSNFQNSNGIEYALINNIRTSLETIFPKEIKNLIFDKTIEGIISPLTSKEDIDDIQKFIEDSDNHGIEETMFSIQEINLDDLLLERTIISIPILTNYGTVPIFSSTFSFFKTTEIINLLGSEENDKTLNARYAELELKAVQENNNNIFSDLESLEYKLKKPVEVVISNFIFQNKFIKEYLQGDKYGTTFKHFGFDYNIFYKKISDLLKNFKLDENITLFDKINNFLESSIIQDILLNHTDIKYICCPNNDDECSNFIFLDNSKFIDLDTGNKINCNEPKNIENFKTNINIMSKILLRPDMILRLFIEKNNLFTNALIAKHPESLLSNIKDDFINTITNIVENISYDNKVNTIYTLMDDSIGEQLDLLKDKELTEIESYKIDLLKKFKIGLKESVKRGYIDRNILKYINNFISRKEVLLDRYEFIGKKVEDFKKIYDKISDYCNKISEIRTRNSNETAILEEESKIKISSELFDIKKFMESDILLNRFSLSDPSRDQPGGAELFSELGDFQNNNILKTKYNDILETIQNLKNLRDSIIVRTDTLTKNNICNQNELSLVEKYMKNREEWYDKQFEFYKLYLLSKSNEIFTELNNKYENNNTNITNILVAYEKELNKLVEKYKLKKDDDALHVRIADSQVKVPSESTQQSTHAKVSSQFGQQPITAEPRQSMTSTHREGIAENLKKSEETKEGLQERLEEGLEERLEEGLTENLGIDISQQFGGDDIFSYFSKLIGYLPPAVTSTPPYQQIDVKSDTEKKITQENKSALEVCETYNDKWWVEYDQTQNIYDIYTNPSILNRAEAIGCSKNNLLYELSSVLNNFFINFIKYLTSMMAWLVTGTGGVSIATCLSAGAKAAWSGGVTAIILFLGCIFLVLGTFFGPCIVYFFHLVLSVAMKGILKDKNLFDKPNITRKILLVSWFYSVQSLNKIINDQGIGINACSLFEGLFQTINPDFDINNLDKMSRNLLSNYKDQNGIINNNAVGIINLGQKEDGKNYNSPVVILDIITSLIEENKNLYDELKLKLSSDTLSCDDFKMDKTDSGSVLQAVILITIENFAKLQKPDIGLNYLSCLFFDDLNVLNLYLKKTTLSYTDISYILSRIGYNTFRIMRIFIDFNVFLLGNKKIRPLTLTYLFGSSSTFKNPNIGRNIIDAAFGQLELEVKNNNKGKTDEEIKKIFVQNLKQDLSEVFGSFFTLFYNAFLTFIDVLKDFVTNLSLSEKQDIDDIDKMINLWDDIEKKCKKGINFSDTCVDEFKSIILSIKEYINIPELYKLPDNFSLKDLQDLNLKIYQAVSKDPDNFYKQFEFNANKRIDETKKNQQLKTMIKSYITIINTYAEKEGNKLEIKDKLLNKAKENKNGAFIYSLQNYLDFNNMTEDKLSSALFRQLMSFCEQNSYLIITRDKENKIKYSCTNFDKDIIDKSSEFIEYYIEFQEKFNKDYQQFINEKTNHIDEYASDVKLKILTILDNISTLCERNGLNCIDTTEFDTFMKKYDSDYQTLLREIESKPEDERNELYSKFQQLNKEYFEFLNNYIDLIDENVSVNLELIDRKIEIIESMSESENKKQILNQLKLVENKLKNIDLNLIREKFEKLLKEDVDYTQLLYRNYTKEFFEDELNKTDDVDYFAITYLTNAMTLDGKKISDNIYNLQASKIKDIINGTLSLYSEEIQSKITANEEKIIQVAQKLFYYKYSINQAIENDQPYLIQPTKTSEIYLNGKTIKSNEQLLEELGITDQWLQSRKDMKKGLRGSEIKSVDELITDLYQYGYYLGVPSKQELEKQFRSKVFYDRPIIMLNKISTRYNSLSNLSYIGVLGLPKSSGNYIENNGSITKYNNMLPPILLDYKIKPLEEQGEKDKYIYNFIDKNYEKFEIDGKVIHVLKMDLELYMNSYIDFDKNEFVRKIIDSLQLKDEIIDKGLKSRRPVLDFMTTNNKEDYREYFGMEFDYFYKKELGGMINPQLNSIEKILEYARDSNIEEIYANFPSIFPLSLFQVNLNNVEIKIKDDTIDLGYHIGDQVSDIQFK